MATVTTPVTLTNAHTIVETDIRLSGITVDGTDETFHGRCAYTPTNRPGQLRRGVGGLSADRRIATSAIWTHTTMAALEGKQPVAQVRAPPWHLAAIAHVQRRFSP